MSSKITHISPIYSKLRDNCVVAISGFNLATTPEYLIHELYRHYLESGHPKNIFIISDALPATPGRALDSIAQRLYEDTNQEFLRGALLPFLGFSPWLQRLVTEERIDCYGWPIGIAAYWFREIASGRPGLITKIGIDTFLDPRQDGGALNESGKKKMSCKINIIDIGGEDYLLYQAPKPDLSLIRATTADENGNLSMEDEGIRGTVLGIAQATKARPNQGIVLAQVRWLTKAGTISPRDVDIPGPLVDHIIISPKKYHWQAGTIEYDPRISYRIVPPITEKLVEDVIGNHEVEAYDRLIAKRILTELVKLYEEKQAPVLVNLGIGIPALVSSIAAEENITEFIVTVVESGPWGGIALSGTDFGLAMSPFALSTIPDMFSNFEGGIIDVASLGFLEVDNEGNVNPSLLPGRIFGPGGFPVIAGGAPKILFGGSFTSGRKRIDVMNNELRISEDGKPKFVDSVFKVIFSGPQALKYQKEILYITERACFRLAKEGLILEEVAPGIDLEKDIIKKMEFTPVISPAIKEMNRNLFKDATLGMRDGIMRIMRK